MLWKTAGTHRAKTDEVRFIHPAVAKGLFLFVVENNSGHTQRPHSVKGFIAVARGRDGDQFLLCRRGAAAAVAAPLGGDQLMAAVATTTLAHAPASLYTSVARPTNWRLRR